MSLLKTIDRTIAKKVKEANLPMFRVISSELESIAYVGTAYNNPKFWKDIYMPVKVGNFSLKSSFKFNDKEVEANFKELMDFLCNGKPLQQEHIDFIKGTGIFADNYDGLKKDIDRYIEYISNKKE